MLTRIARRLGFVPVADKVYWRDAWEKRDCDYAELVKQIWFAENRLREISNLPTESRRGQHIAKRTLTELELMLWASIKKKAPD